jgi:hypothetical protein
VFLTWIFGLRRNLRHPFSFGPLQVWSMTFYWKLAIVTVLVSAACADNRNDLGFSRDGKGGESGAETGGTGLGPNTGGSGNLRQLVQRRYERSRHLGWYRRSLGERWWGGFRFGRRNGWLE